MMMCALVWMCGNPSKTVFSHPLGSGGAVHAYGSLANRWPQASQNVPASIRRALAGDSRVQSVEFVQDEGGLTVVVYAVDNQVMEMTL